MQDLLHPKPVVLFVVLDDVDAAGDEAYRQWQCERLGSLSELPWVARAIGWRGVDELPGGIRKGELYPRYMTLVELDPNTAPSDDAIRARIGAPTCDVRRIVARSYQEFSLSRRDGALLSERPPRAAFVIGQKVYSGQHSTYNAWFDVDDRSRDGTGLPPISHFRERLSYPGFVRGTRMIARERVSDDSRDDYPVPDYLTLYEVESPATLQTEAYSKSPQNKRSAGGGGMFRLLIRHTYVELVR